MNRRIYFIIAVLALLFWGTFTVLKSVSEKGPGIGLKAPQFQLEDLNGQQVGLDSFHGKVVLLNLWATWCGPCRQEIPSLEQLYLKYKNDNFTVLGVSLDEEGWDPVRSFLKVVPVSFPIVLDKEQKVSELFQTFRVPETYLIDSTGKIADKFVGPQDFNQPVFADKIERLLKKK